MLDDLANPNSFFSNTQLPPTKPLTAHAFKRDCQRQVARMKRRHYTGRLLPGLVVPMDMEEHVNAMLEADATLMALVKAAMQPESCYCRGRKCQEEKP